MASVIYLQADLKGNAETKIKQIDALAKQLSSTPITIKVNTQGIDNLSKDIISLANNQAKAQAAANQLALAQEKTKQAVEKTAQAIEKTTQAQEKTRQAVEKTTQTQNRLAIETQKTDRSFAQMNTTAQTTSSLLDSIAAKFTFANLAATAIYKLTAAFKDSITTLKEVDTQLVDIQKVTDMTDKEMDDLTESSYELASAMGRTATEVLNSSVEFARAGYGDQIEELSELSILTQNIGDIENETANKFILAADAAWDLNGEAENLMPILDGLNEITNKNATDMEKLASGVTVAASVFAQADESMQTFAAMLGTTTAATQRSGEEMARGLRTILMNIRQIKGETEDGELIDGESIANASKALKEYADISTMANGELRKSSEVLEELAGKWESLDSVAQSAIGEALAGKRQANVLNALMSNWDMYEKMLQDYADGAGSALRENEIYLNSWEAKSKQLSSTWTEFVSHLINTDAIKDGLDNIIGLVELLDTDVGRAVITVGALSTAVVLLQKGFTKLNTVIQANPLFWKSAAVIAGIMAVITVFDALTTTYDEHIEKIEELTSQYEEAQSEIDELTAKIEENNAVIEGSAPLADGQSVEFLQQQNDALENQVNILKERQKILDEQKNQEIRDAYSSRNFVDNDKAGERLSNALAEQENFYQSDAWISYKNNPQSLSSDEVASLIAQENTYKQNVQAARDSLNSSVAEVLGYEQEIQNLTNEIESLSQKPLLSDEEEQRLQDARLELSDIGTELSDLRNSYTADDDFASNLDEQIENINEALQTSSAAAQEASQAMSEAAAASTDWADAVEKLNTEINNLQSAYSTLTNAVNEYNSSGMISVETFQQLLELGPEYYSLLVNENGQLSLNTSAYQQLTAAKIENMAISQSLEVVQQALDYVAQGQTDALYNLLNITNDNTNATWGLVNAKLSAIAAYEREGTVAEGTTASLEKYVAAMRKASQAAIAGIGSGYSGISSSSASSSSASSSASSLLSELNQAVNKELEKAKDAMQEQVDAIDAQIDALKAARDLEKNQLDIEEKKLAVLKAQKDLENAQNERTVRMLIGDTWQWVADQGAVESAQEALDEAQNELKEAQIELAYQQQLEELERQKEQIQAQYEAYVEQWEAIQESMQEPTRDINEILADIAENGTPEMKAQVENVSALLSQLGVAISSAIASINSRSYSSSSSSGSSSSTNYNPSTGGSGKTNTPAYNTGKNTVSSGVGSGIAGSMNAAHSAGSSVSSSVGLGLGKFFDSGGVAGGLGFMPKGTSRDEMVLGPDMTAKILSPSRNNQFRGFVDAIEHMFTMSDLMKPRSDTLSNDSHDTNYYINGVKIGDSEKNKPLSQVLSTLALHTDF